MRELDALLTAFVERYATGLSDDEAVCFEAILELPDAVLYDYLLGRDAPADPLTAKLVERIRDGNRA
jgi:succinate dehydrogenase flavin-adding protein (antitoxin of CptAB toxin-antitoxin module)